MDKRLKIGLLLMTAAVVLLPVAFLLKNVGQSITLIFLIFTMPLELIGLFFVISSILKKYRSKGYD